MDDIDKTFDALRHIDFDTMKRIVYRSCTANVYSVMLGMKYVPHFGSECESLLKEYNWTLDEFNNEFRRRFGGKDE